MSSAACPCGSGQTFESCCGAVTGFEGVQPEAPATHISGAFRARAFPTKAHQTLLAHVGKTFGLGVLADETTRRLLGGQGGTVSLAAQLSDVIGSWRLFDWVHGEVGTTIAEHWLASAHLDGQVDPDTLKTIESASGRAMSFHQVQAVDPGRGLVVRNLLAEEETFVVDASASEALPRWAVVLARLVEFRTLTCFETLAPTSLSPSMAAPIVRSVQVELGASVPLSDRQLRSCSLDLIEIYVEALRGAPQSERPPALLSQSDRLAWPDRVLPALGGFTPREAVATSNGRSRVEALLRELEFRAQGTPLGGSAFDEVRSALGLAVTPLD